MVYEEQTDKYCQSDTSVSENKDTHFVITQKLIIYLDFTWNPANFMSNLANFMSNPPETL